MDSVDKAFEDLLALNLRLKRIHHFSSGVSGKEMRSDGDQCASCGHWSLITAGMAEKSTVSVKTLIQACRVGRVDAIRSIVTVYEVDVNSTDSYGWTALHFATLHNQKEVVKCLKKLGANEKLDANDDFSPLDMRPELFGKDQEPWQVPETSDEMYDEIFSWDYTPRLKYYPVFIARVLRMFDKFGKEMFDIDFFGPDTVTDRDLFICKGARIGWVSLCRMFLELGADVNMQHDFGQSMLHVACDEHNDERVQMLLLLLEAGANIDQQDVDDWTALHLVCMNNDVESVRLLLKAKADVNKRDIFGYTPLKYACEKHNVECARLLLDAGADVNQRNISGETILQNICVNPQSVECVQLLLEAGADVNIRDNRGQTAVFATCWRNNVECARLLLEAGADVNIRNNRDQTALHIACSQGHMEIMQLLEAHQEREEDVEVPSAKRQRRV